MLKRFSFLLFTFDTTKKKDLSNQYIIVNLSFFISRFLFGIQIFPQNSELIVRVVNSPPLLFPKGGMLEKEKD